MIRLPIRWSPYFVVVAVVMVLLTAVAWQIVDGLATSIQLSFADEQTEVFCDMVRNASEAVNQEPPDVDAAVGFLSYTHSYYPSGTKLRQESHIDRIVERSRWLAEAQIIDMLRVATGEDFGTDTDAWVREFGNHKVPDNE
jgi:hypothetical protein